MCATGQFVGHSDLVPCSEAFRIEVPSCGKVFVAIGPTFGLPLILLPVLKRWGTPDGGGYIATCPTCGPPLILSAALNFGEPQGGTGYVATTQRWATSDFVPGTKALGPPRR